MNDLKISCVVVDDELHARRLLKKYIQQSGVLDLVGEFPNAQLALKGITGLQPELIFLDVQMPGKTGIEMLEMLDEPERYMIIFTTAYDQYALKAFERSAVDYLLKPFDEDRFSMAIDKVKRMRKNPGEEADKLHRLLLQMQLQNKPGDSFLEQITCKVANRLKILHLKDVLYIEAEGNYTQAYTAERGYLLDVSISDIQQRLDPNVFVRIHRSSIVNRQFISSIEPHFNGEYKIELHNKVVLKVSRSYKSEFNRIMGVF